MATYKVAQKMPNHLHSQVHETPLRFILLHLSYLFCENKYNVYFIQLSR